MISNIETFQLILNISDGKDVESDEIGEHFWGEILERTCSVNNMKESDRSDCEGQWRTPGVGKVGKFA